MHPRALTLVLALCANLASQSTPKLLVVGVDGVRPDALVVARTPNIDALISAGSYSAMAQTEDLTFSGPNWATILHGVHRDKHGVITNSYTNSQLANYPDFLAHLESHQKSWNTARLTTWDAIHRYQPTGADIDLFSDYASGGDAEASKWAEQLILGTHKNYKNLDIDVVFLYLADPDVAGHAHGFHPEARGYVQEIEDVDAQIGRLMAAIKARKDYSTEDWLIIMTSDHGGSITGSHSGNTTEKRSIPFLVSGPSAIVGTPFPAPRNVDVSKTALSHMGARIPAGLDGHVVGLAPSSPPKLVYDANLIYNGGAEYDRGFAGLTADQYLAGWDDPGPDQTTAIAYDTPGGWPLSTDPGPPNRGKNFFSGNSVLGSRLTQTIQLAGFATAIDAAMVSFELAGWLGGYAGQNDRAKLAAYFRDASGALLGVSQIGPVTNTHRGNRTGLLYRQTSAGVPKGSRHVVIALDTFFATGGSTDGYADELSFVLRSKSSAPPAAITHFVPTPRSTEWRFTGDTGVFIDSVYGPGTMEYADGIGGNTAKNDKFGVSDGTTVPHLDGVPVRYLNFKKRSKASEGYKVRVGIASPGDIGIRQFTMIMDIYVKASNKDKYLGIWNGSATNSNDCEFFLRLDNTGYWTTNGGTRDGSWRRGEWNRFAFVEDYTAGTVKLYRNGSPVLELRDRAADFVFDGNPNPFWFLGDDTSADTGEGYIANFAFVDASLGARVIGALGGPSADGIFVTGLQSYGCGVNPSDSLTRLDGLPMLGTTLTLGVHNSRGTQRSGSATVLVFSPLPDAGFPCGTRIPNWGMQSATASGELLVAPPWILIPGPTWTGTVAAFPLAIPNSAGLLGLSTFVQGVILDGAAGKVGLAGAMRITLY